MESDKIRKIVDEVIKRNDKNLSELKKLTMKFFKGKTQQDFNKVDQKFLKALKESYDLLKKSKKLTEVDRAFLDFNFKNGNGNMKEYLCFSKAQEYDEKKLKALAFEIYSRKIFGKKGDDFLSFLGFVWMYEYSGDDIELTSEKRDIYMHLSVRETGDDMGILLLGSKRYKGLFNKVSEIMK